MLLFNQQLITLDRAAWHEEYVRVLDVNRVLKKELVNDHLHRLKLRPHDVYLRDSLTPQVRHLDFFFVGEPAVLCDIEWCLVGLGVEEVHHDLVEGILHDQAALLVEHIEVLQETVSEEVVDDMKAVRISIGGVIGGGARTYSLDHVLYRVLSV